MHSPWARSQRLEEAKEKVQEIQENLKRKEKARAKYAAWVAEQERARGQGKAATDYTAWDLWVPSDDEDEMIRNLTPSGPEFAAMEVRRQHSVRVAIMVAMRRWPGWLPASPKHDG